MGGELKIQELFQIGQARPQIIPMIDSRLHKRRELFELLPANRCLGIQWFQIVTDMAVDVLVVVPLGQLAKLPAESLVTGVVLPACAPAIASPVPETLHQ